MNKNTETTTERCCISINQKGPGLRGTTTRCNAKAPEDRRVAVLMGGDQVMPVCKRHAKQIDAGRTLYASF